MGDRLSDVRAEALDALQRMNAAVTRHQAAHGRFLVAAQVFDWDAAAQHQLEASAQADMAMDYFVKACRAQQYARS